MKSVVLQKLENITNCIQRIESKKPFSYEILKNNFDLQDTISVNLQRAIQACIDLAAHIVSEKNARSPADAFIVLFEIGFLTKETSDHMIQATGLRNVIVHEYDGIDWAIVHRVCEQNLSLFKVFAKEILEKT